MELIVKSKIISIKVMEVSLNRKTERSKTGKLNNGKTKSK